MYGSAYFYFAYHFAYWGKIDGCCLHYGRVILGVIDPLFEQWVPHSCSSFLANITVG